jgi:hypothetical protein
MSAKYKTKKILIKRSYQFLALILLLLAVGLVLIPKHAKHEGIRPELFVKNILSGERYISTDELAERIISQDPSLILIDTRTEDAFNKFTLPNAMNLPLADVFNEEINYFLDQEIYDVVLFSNDNFLADEVWMLGNRMGYQRLYVLQGGLNEWFNTIIHPQVPKQTKSQDAFDLYSFRRAAGRYFGVANDTLEIKPVKVKKVAPKKVITQPKKKKRAPEGGC